MRQGTTRKTKETAGKALDNERRQVMTKEGKTTTVGEAYKLTK